MDVYRGWIGLLLKYVRLVVIYNRVPGGETL